MAFAFAIDPTSPAGSDQVKLGDDNIRSFKSAVRERLASIFVDVDTDPYVLKTNARAMPGFIIGATAPINSGHGLLLNPTLGPTNDIGGLQCIPQFAAGAANQLYAATFFPVLLAGSYVVDHTYGVLVENVTKGAGVTLTTQYGLNVRDQTQGATNYAIKTGLGLVSFGDSLEALSDVAIATNAKYLRAKTSGGILVNLLSLTADANNITRFLAGVDAGGFQWTNQGANNSWMVLTSAILQVNCAVLQTGTKSVRFENTVLGGGPVGATGVGIELGVLTASSSAFLFSFNRTTLVDAPLIIEASAITFNGPTQFTNPSTFQQPIIHGAFATYRAPVQTIDPFGVALLVDGGSNGSTIVRATIVGDNGAGARFCDVVVYQPGGNFSVISSTNLSGAPSARTYSVSPTGLKLLMPVTVAWTVRAESVDL